MKKNIRIKKIISMLLIAVLIITTKVYAAKDHYETTLTANKTQAKAGDTITITIGLSNIAIESGEKGIGSYTSNIKFDSSVLEYVSTSSSDKWEAPTYNSGAIVGYTKDGKVVNTPQSIGTITFKVKKDAKLGETIISLENFSGSTGVTDINAGNKSTKIAIVGDSTNNNDANNNTESNNPGNDNNDKKPNTSGNKANTIDTRKENVVKGVLPRAGSANIKVFATIGGAMLLALALYIRFKVTAKKM